MSFISVCLFFISSISLVIVLTVLIISPFYFPIFGASLLSISWILFQVDCLFPLYLSLWIIGLILLFILYFSVFSFLSFFLSFFFCSCFCFFLTCSTLGLSSPGFTFYSFILFFAIGGKIWLSGLCCVLVRVSCVCVIVGGDKADQSNNYRNNGTYTHTCTHIVITKVV